MYLAKYNSCLPTAIIYIYISIRRSTTVQGLHPKLKRSPFDPSVYFDLCVYYDKYLCIFIAV